MKLTAQNVSLFISAALAMVIGFSLPSETAAALGWVGEEAPGFITGISIIVATCLGAWAITSTPL